MGALVRAWSWTITPAHEPDICREQVGAAPLIGPAPMELSVKCGRLLDRALSREPMSQGGQHDRKDQSTWRT